MLQSRNDRVKIDRNTRSALIALAGAFFLAIPQELPADVQDDWDAEGHADAAAAQHAQQFNVEANLNCWIFDGETADHAREKAELVLTLRLDSMERAGGLSKAQIEKLELAGCNDITCFFRRVETVKEECKGTNFNDQKFQKIWPKLSALQAELHAGLFDEKSLFHKVLQGMTRSDASAPYQEQERERRKFRHRASIELAVTMFEMGVPLTDVQRRKFLTLLCEETKPPKRFGSQDQFVVFYQASKLDEAKLRPIFDDAQWRAVKSLFLQAKGMESHLKSQGFIP